MYFVRGEMYKTRNGSKVLCVKSNGSFKVISLKKDDAFEKYDNGGWSGLLEGDFFQVNGDGFYIGIIRELDIISEWKDCKFVIGEEYKTKNRSLVKYLGNQEFQILDSGKISKKNPWIQQEKDTRYFTNEDGKYLGAFRELDVVLDTF